MICKYLENGVCVKNKKRKFSIIAPSWCSKELCSSYEEKEKVTIPAHVFKVDDEDKNNE